MAIKKYGPTTPGRRGMTVTDYSVLSKVAPDGDLSENSEYDEAKNTQGLVENRITELEQMIKNAVIIDESELSVDKKAET